MWSRNQKPSALSVRSQMEAHIGPIFFSLVLPAIQRSPALIRELRPVVVIVAALAIILAHSLTHIHQIYMQKSDSRNYSCN